MSSQNILIVGTGAIGAFFASRLASVPNVSVSVVCRSNFQAVQKYGIRVISPTFGDTTFNPKRTFASTEDVKRSKERWRWLLVTTKVLPELGDPSKILDGLVDEETGIVLLQNGLGIEKPYHHRFPNSSIISATTRTSVASKSPDTFQHYHWTRTTIGPYSPQSTSLATQRTTEFASLLHNAGIPDVDVLDHTGMQFARWLKTAINAAMNPTSVLSHGTTNQSMALDEELYLLMKATMTEILNAATKVLGEPLPQSLPKIEDVLEGVKEDASGSKPSMWADWEAGRRVELEAILGEPLRQAREVGIELPRTQTMYALLKMAQQIRLGTK